MAPSRKKGLLKTQHCLKNQGKRIINRSAPKIAPSRENGLSKPQASLLHAFCACNYIHLPLARQHKTSVFVSRFAPSRYFYSKNKYNAFALSYNAFALLNFPFSTFYF